MVGRDESRMVRSGRKARRLRGDSAVWVRLECASRSWRERGRLRDGSRVGSRACSARRGAPSMWGGYHPSSNPSVQSLHALGVRRRLVLSEAAVILS